MIERLSISNIRLFQAPGVTIDLAPLTVFCGTNSSGKSTILKSLLLLRQSMGIREEFGNSPGRLKPEGSQVDLGTYGSLVSEHDEQRDITIGLSVRGVMPSSALDNLAGAGFAFPPTTSKRSGPQPYCLESTFTFSARSPLQEAASSGLDQTDRSSALSRQRGWLRTLEQSLNIKGQPVLGWRVTCEAAKDDDKVKYYLHVPRRYLESCGFTKIFRIDDANSEGFVKVSTALQGLLPNVIVAQLKSKNDKPGGTENKRKRWAVGPLPPHIDNPKDLLVDALRELHYLGPLRSPAKRIYLTTSGLRPGMDASGDFMPYVLRDQVETPVRNSSLNGPAPDGCDTLGPALNYWLYYLRTGEFPDEKAAISELCVSNTAEFVVQCEIRSPLNAERFSIADSGFGYSQVMPILIRGLLVPKGGTLIVEQPELHLNPALQLRIAAFFVAMVRAGKQVILETHSEHIVNSIRVLAGEDETNAIAPQTSICFIGFDNNKLSIHELGILPDGTVPEWPIEFFGEAAQLAGRLLRIQHRYLRSQKK